MPNYFIPDSEQELNEHNEQLAQIEQEEIPQEQHEAEIIANMITEAQKHNVLVEVVYFFSYFLGDMGRILDRTIYQDQSELIATNPAEYVAVSRAFFDQDGNLFEQLISSYMTTRIIDQFELIEIDKNERVLFA